MNVFTGIGRLTATPELRQTQSGRSVCNYTLAIDRPGKDAGTDFLRCVCWEKTAEFAAKYLTKGSKVAITGSVQTSKYDGPDGKPVNKTEILVRQHDFCDSRKPTEGNTTPQEMPADLSDFEEVGTNESDLPF